MHQDMGHIWHFTFFASAQQQQQQRMAVRKVQLASAETFAFWDGAVAAAVVAVAVAPFHRRRVAAAAGFFHGGGVAAAAIALFHVGSVATAVCHRRFFLVDCVLAVFSARDVWPDPGHHEPLALVRLA